MLQYAFSYDYFVSNIPCGLFEGTAEISEDLYGDPHLDRILLDGPGGAQVVLDDESDKDLHSKIRLWLLTARWEDICDELATQQAEEAA